MKHFVYRYSADAVDVVKNLLLHIERSGCPLDRGLLYQNSWHYSYYEVSELILKFNMLENNKKRRQCGVVFFPLEKLTNDQVRSVFQYSDGMDESPQVVFFSDSGSRKQCSDWCIVVEDRLVYQ